MQECATVVPAFSFLYKAPLMVLMYITYLALDSFLPVLF